MCVMFLLPPGIKGLVTFSVEQGQINHQKNVQNKRITQSNPYS